MNRSFLFLAAVAAAASLSSGCEWAHELEIVSAEAGEPFSCEHASHVRTCVDYDLVLDMHNVARSASVEAVETISLWSTSPDDGTIFSLVYDVDCAGSPWDVPAGERTGPIPLRFAFSRADSTYELSLPCDGDSRSFAPRDFVYDFSPRAGDNVAVRLLGSMGSTPAPEFAAFARSEL